MSEYLNIINIQVLHEYYTDGKCRLFQLRPDTDTQQWVQQMGWRIVQRENQWQLFAPASTDLAQLIQDNPDVKLNFEGSSADSQFISFTDDLPLDERGVLVFSSSSDSSGALSSTVLPSEFEASSNGNPAVVARVQLHLNGLENNTDREPIDYKVSFKSRAVAWKYLFIDASNTNAYVLSLKGDKADLFTGPSQEQLPNATAAQVFDSSPNLLPFREKNEISLSLLGKASGDETVLVEHLPNASPSSLDVSEAEGQQTVYSAIYVYI